MKALPLVLLALVLCAGALYLVLDVGSSPRSGPAAVERGPSPRLPGGARARAEAEAAAARAQETSAPEVPPEEVEAQDEPARRTVDAAPAPELRCAYEGTVIGDGVPLPGAHVQLSAGGEARAEAETDARGKFRLEAPPARTSELLSVRARGFVPVERTLAPRPNGGLQLLGNLRLIRGARLVGRVLDGRGTGVADAEVTAEPISAGGDVLRAHGRSGADGRFELPEAPPGGVRVRVRATGFGETAVDYSPARGEPLEVRLAPGADLALRLVGPRGEPVVDAEVSLQSTGDARAAPRAARSDAAGRVLFDGLGAGNWSVRVVHADFRPIGRNQLKAGGREETIECQPWPAIEGLVRAPDGSTPPAGTRVLALPALAPGDGLSAPSAGTAVDAQGHFRLGGLRAGDWIVRASAPGFAPTSSPTVRLGIEGDGWAGTIQLDAGGRLLFQITCEGKAVAGAEVELVPSAPSAPQLWALRGSHRPGASGARSDRAGRVELTSLPRGTLWLLVFAEGSPPTCTGPFTVDTSGQGSAAPIALERGARLRGRVRGADGAPVPAAQLRLTEGGGRLGFPLTLVAEEDGGYTSAWLPAGHYTIEAFVAERRSGPTEFDLAAGEERSLDLSL